MTRPIAQICALCRRRLPVKPLKTARSYASSSKLPATPISDEWRTVIGLEIHAQLKTGRKLFSKTPLTYNAPPNTLVDPHDAAFPGTLPVLDKEAVRLSLLTALALNCDITPRSTFDRKHYFYHDIPASYQITQHYNPLATNGHLTLPHTPTSSGKKVRIKQLQIEQDTAKSQTVGSDVLVDLNRAGTGLMEIVTEPDMTSVEEAGAFVRRLQGLLRRVGSGDGDMEKGNLRIDANVSVHRPNTPYGTRCEIKNLNSIRFLQTAITFEVQRHIAHYTTSLLPLKQETRQVNESTGETYSLRSKEEATDYRYMPDSNLPALVFPQGTLEMLKEGLPEMPWDTVQRLVREYPGLEARDIETMISLDEYEGRGVKYYQDVMNGLGKTKGKKAANWMCHEVLGQLGKVGKEWEEGIVPSRILGEIVQKVEEGEISGTTGKTVFRHLISTPGLRENKGLEEILDELGLKPASADDLLDLCQRVIESCSKEADMVRNGNEKVAMRLVGEVMKQSQGRADAKKAREIILDILRNP